MSDLINIIENPLMRTTYARQRLAIKAAFPEISKCDHDNYLALNKYDSRIPYCFFSNSIHSLVLSWLEKRDGNNRKALQDYLSINDSDLNRALLHLEDINRLGFHDHFKKPDDYEMIRFIDKEIHPCYLRLTEAVFFPLCRLFAFFLRGDQQKGTDDLDALWPVVRELENTELSGVIKPYIHLVRNGIAHGGITYLQNEIKYKDKNGNEATFSDFEIIRAFDDLLDICNALVLSLSIFLLTHQKHGYKIIQQLLLDELIEETSAPWWKIIGCTPSFISGLKQLTIYARPNTFDGGKVQVSIFQSGVLAERLAPGYDRYFISIHSDLSLPGWASFDGIKLRQLREKRAANLNDYMDAINDKLIFFIPKLKVPRIFNRIHTLFVSFILHWSIFIDDFHRQIGRTIINVREARIHKNSYWCVLNGTVFIDNYSLPITQKTIKNIKHAIVKSTLSVARKKTPWFDISRYLPLGFASISVYRKNYRRRQLYGLGPDLICTIRIKHIKRIQCPDIMGSTIELAGKYRVAWNKAWLEDIKGGEA